MTRIIKADAIEQEDSPKAAALNLADFVAEARNIVLDARKAAARITAEARARADSLERQARQKAFAEGFARGQSDGYADGILQAREETERKYSDEYKKTLALVGDVVRGLSASRTEAIQNACGDIIEMSVLLAGRIVGNVVADDVEVAKANLAKVLELAHGGGQIVVKVNPGQLESLREYFHELIEALTLGDEVRLLADERISSGGVKLLSPHGQIDATIEAQLDNAARILLGKYQGEYQSEEILTVM